MSIDLSTAKAITAGAQTHAAAEGLQPLTVVVLDAGGHVVSVERQDGASNGRFDIARGKANAALTVGMGSRAMFERAQQQPFFVTAVGATVGGNFVPVPGGVLVLDQDGLVLGAVGISGDNSDNDEAAAVAGIRAAGLDFKID